MSTFEERQRAVEHAENRATALRGAAELALGGITEIDRFCALLALCGPGYSGLLRAIRAAERERGARIAGEIGDVRGRSECSVWAQACDAAING